MLRVKYGLFLFYSFGLYLLAVQRIQPRALNMLGKHSTSKPHSQHSFYFLFYRTILEMIVHIAQACLKYAVYAEDDLLASTS